MTDRYDRERGWRNWDNEEGLRSERRGPQGFTRDDWRRARPYPRLVENPIENIDDYSMRHREQRERGANWDVSRERDRWMDYGREFDPRFDEGERDWQRRGQLGRGWRSQQGSQWQPGYEELGFDEFDYQDSQRPLRERRERRGDWDDHEMEYGRGVYEQRHGRHDRSGRDWEESRPTRKSGAYGHGYRQQNELIAESVSGVLDVHNHIRVEGRGRQGWSGAREESQTRTGIQSPHDSGEQV